MNTQCIYVLPKEHATLDNYFRLAKKIALSTSELFPVSISVALKSVPFYLTYDGSCGCVKETAVMIPKGAVVLWTYGKLSAMVQKQVSEFKDYSTVYAPAAFVGHEVLNNNEEEDPLFQDLITFSMNESLTDIGMVTDVITKQAVALNDADYKATFDKKYLSDISEVQDDFVKKLYCRRPLDTFHSESLNGKTVLIQGKCDLFRDLLVSYIEASGGRVIDKFNGDVDIIMLYGDRNLAHLCGCHGETRDLFLIPYKSALRKTEKNLSIFVVNDVLGSDSFIRFAKEHIKKNNIKVFSDLSTAPKILAKSPILYALMSQEIRSDRQIFTRFCQKKYIPMYADEMILKDEAFCRQMVEKNHGSLGGFLSAGLFKNDRTFILERLRADPFSVMHFPAEYLKDKEIALLCIKRYRGFFDYFDPSIFHDPEFLQTLEESAGFKLNMIFEDMYW